MSTAEPVPLSQVERVYRVIREAIINGDYAPGSPLRLQELSEAHEMSFIPVREAIRRLEAERLVETTPNKGARVADLSLDDIVDAYQTRIVLEVDALRRGYPRITPDVIAEARRMKDEMVRRFNKGQASGFDLHRAIHFLLYEKSDSPWLLHMIKILWHHTERYRRIATGLHPTYDHVGQEHAKVLDALAEKDLERAAQALRLDLEHTAELILATYRNRNGIAEATS